MLKKHVLNAVILLLVGCANTAVQDIERIEKLVNQKDCRGAESVARQNFSGGDLLTVLGVIEIDCKKNYKGGINLIKAAARDGNQKAIQVLVGFGETPPEPTKRIIIQQQQPQRPQQIIIQQPQARPNPMDNNMNRCMQDGGSLYCPNHPSTRLPRPSWP